MIRFINRILKFTKKLKEDHASAYAAQAAYYIMLSFIPFLMLLLSLIKYTPVSKANLMQFMVDMLPMTINPLVTSVIEELYSKSTTLISVTAIMAIWSAARAILAITGGFNSVYDVKETRNYVLLRLYSAFYTILLLVLVVISLIVLVFGESLLNFFKENAPILADVTESIISIRIVGSLLIQTVLFLFLYKLLPNRKGILLLQIPGALFSAIGWNVFSYGFSIYIDRYSNMSYMYGSLTTLIIIMLWLYSCMYIILIGAELNACIEQTPSLQQWEKILRRKK